MATWRDKNGANRQLLASPPLKASPERDGEKKKTYLQSIGEPLTGKHGPEPAAAQQRTAAVLTAERFLH